VERGVGIQLDPHAGGVVERDPEAVGGREVVADAAIGHRAAHVLGARADRERAGARDEPGVEGHARAGRHPPVITHDLAPGAAAPAGTARKPATLCPASPTPANDAAGPSRAAAASAAAAIPWARVTATSPGARCR